MIPKRIKERIKGIGPAQWLNASVKSQWLKYRYNDLCRYYSSPSVLEDSEVVSEIGERMWNSRLSDGPLPWMPDNQPLMVYVGTDWEQDRSGIVQGLGSLCRLRLFEGRLGIPGQIRAATPSEVEPFRQRNAERLVELVESLESEGPVSMVIGQMWGHTMDWRALAALRSRGISVVNISMDDRHAFTGPRLKDGTDSGILGLVPHLSLACTDAPECVPWYEAEGCKAIYFPEASDPDLFRPLNHTKVHDVCFVGSNYGIRNQLAETLVRAGVNVVTYGKGWPNGRIKTEAVPMLFSKSRIILGCGTIGHSNDFFSLKLRDFDGPMSGSLYITHDNPDLQPLFRIGDEMVTFRTIPDMVDKVRFLLANEREREAMARAGRARAVSDHTWSHRFRALFASLHAHAQP